MNLEDFISKKINHLKSINQYRSLELYDEELLNFSSNDYLGLAKNSFDFSDLAAGSTGSRLLTGNSKELVELEKEIADWKNTEAAIFFSSGYMANLGAISALAGPRDVIFSDELNHSCILDGIRLSGAKKFFYRNLDYQHLEELLEKHRTEYDKAFVITDTVFSMQGTCCDLKAITKLKAQHNFITYIDEAHATGTMAKSGAGLYASLVEANEIEAKQVDIQMGTFSKACGVEGAYIAGSKELIDYLINFARTFIFSTAPSPYVISMLRQNLAALINAQEQRSLLEENINYFRAKLKDLRINFSNDMTAIFAINVKTNDEALALSKEFIEQKILVKAIRPPTAPLPCLRICLASWHKKEDLDKLVSILSAKASENMLVLS